jgi:hypothetical protein
LVHVDVAGNDTVNDDDHVNHNDARDIAGGW